MYRLQPQCTASQTDKQTDDNIVNSRSYCVQYDRLKISSDRLREDSLNAPIELKLITAKNDPGVLYKVGMF